MATVYRLSEAQMQAVNNSRDNAAVLTAYNKIPYSLINAELTGSAKGIQEEFTQIAKYYSIYKEGMKFAPEGSNSDYIPAQLRYRLSSTLINKEARFMFAESPDLVVQPKGDVGEVSQDSLNNITAMNDLIKTILDRNDFESGLIKGAKDAFIGKRVAILANFNEEDGITVSFIPSTQFIYETKMNDPSALTKFVCFIVVEDAKSQKEKRIFKKKYEVDEDGAVWLEETLYDGAGTLIEAVTENEKILLDKIPAVVIINDGLTGDVKGESEIEQLKDFEQWYSKLANADVDAERKGMNPIKYTLDISPQSTKGLGTGAGAYWDLQTDQNLPQANPKVGTIEGNMSYSNSLKTTLDRIRQAGFEQVDMPAIDLESMKGTITSGKALKAIYWPLIVRCKEKMKTWAPQLRRLVTILIDGAMAYEEIAKQYTDSPLVPVKYEVSVEINHPLPEDETEEKNMDLAEVDSGVMSRKAYMMKWRGLTEDEVQAELEQMLAEREFVEGSHSAPAFGDVVVQ